MEPDPRERYWLFAGDRVTGPFDLDALMELDEFTADAPLCPEAKLGTAEEEWRPAVAYPDFAPLFPSAGRGQAAPAGHDVAAIGAIEGRMRLLDRSLAAARKRLSARQDAFVGLKNELSQRLRAAQEIEERIQQAVVRIQGGFRPSPEMERAKAAMAMQQKRIEELQKDLARFQARQAAPRPPAPEPEPEAEEPGAPAEAPEAAPRSRTRRRAQRTPVKAAVRRRKKPLSDPGASGLPDADFSDDIPGL
ncbi:MAG: hypothetical protein A2X36_09390 [Elusimicrobia bacterium GWA2_69_24]|nr:MAG: hypothetical protein A2X36_09390 [Elusimicrobia bacterium GWA2_69_24]HBL15956.1 hypothetical protein [Elusimicrobiota bacterium]